MNTANWVPDLFMKRVSEDQQWTLFSPHEAPDLHELSGKTFEERYTAYEQMADNGEIKNFKELNVDCFYMFHFKSIFFPKNKLYHLPSNETN